MQQLQDNFPARKKLLAQSITKMSPINNFKDLRGTLFSPPIAMAPGSGGLYNKFLVAMGERMEDNEIKLMPEPGHG